MAGPVIGNGTTYSMFAQWGLLGARVAAGLVGIAGLVGAVMTAVGGDRAQVTAAVPVFRALTWFLPILVGVGCYLWWRRTRLASQPATEPSPP